MHENIKMEASPYIAATTGTIRNYRDTELNLLIIQKLWQGYENYT